MPQLNLNLTPSLKPHPTVGLDIGTSAVRAAELDTKKARPVLLTYGQVGLPPGALVDGEIHDSFAVTEAITKLWKNGQFSSSSVIVGIAGLRAITREIDLPFVPDGEVASAVRFQSEEVIPFPPDQTILSSQVLADYTSADGEKMRRVLVAAAHVDMVNGVIAAVERAGLTVEGVDLISSALVRAIGEHDGSDQPEAIVSIGAGLTVVVVHQSGRPQFVRTIGSGGNATTEAVSAALDLPIADAEAVKRRIGEAVAQMQDAGRAAQPSMVRPGWRDQKLDPVLCIASRSTSRLASPGHRRRLRSLRSCVHAGGADPDAGSHGVPARTPGRIPARPHRGPGRRGRSGPRRTHRTGTAGARQGSQEVQPASTRGGQPSPNEADPGAHPDGRCCRPDRSTRVRWLEVPPGAQRPEQREPAEVEHCHAQRPSSQVRPGGGREQCVHRRSGPPCVRAQLRGRLATRAERVGCHHPGPSRGRVLHRHQQRNHWNRRRSAGKRCHGAGRDDRDPPARPRRPSVP